MDDWFRTVGASPADDTVTKTDRRRPGRPDNVSPELIPLLRGQVDPPAPWDPALDEPDQLRGSRGLAVGFVLSGILWAGLLSIGRWILF